MPMSSIHKGSYKSIMGANSYGIKSELKPDNQSLIYLNAGKFPTTRKKIGKLSPEERQKKIDRYREKRNLRVWGKRINYNCRKKVADKRVRIKGRFVSKAEASVISRNIKEFPGEDEKEVLKQSESDKSEKTVKKIFNVISKQEFD